MAGGIYTNRPFEANPKCIVMGLAACMMYWFLPAQRNPFMLPIIFIIVYIIMAWYDWLYNCNTKMYTGYGTPVGWFDSIFKPQRRDEVYKDPKDPAYKRDIYLLPNQERHYKMMVYVFHLLAVAPIAIYIGIKGKDAHEKAFGPLLALGGMAAAYHGFKLIASTIE